jgi:hypothetical protein
MSERFKHAFKIALAMVITYAIAMGMNWDKPFWAGLSVAFCSLATAGESIDRGIQRALGTMLSGVAVLTLMALFPQERWLFLLSMSAFIGVCTYRWSGGSRNGQIWFNAGFNFPILAILGGGLALNSFEYVILRAQETTLGVVVYSLVAVLVWPRRGGERFRDNVRAICDAQRRLVGHYSRSATRTPADGDSAGDAGPLRAQIAGQLAALGGQLQGAAFDSAEIWRARRTWRRGMADIAALNGALDRWRAGLADLEHVDVPMLLPSLASFCEELEGRLAGIADMLSGQAPTAQPRAIELHADQDTLRSLRHRERAAALSCRDQLVRIDALTRTLFDTFGDICGYPQAESTDRPGTTAPTLPVIDLDRLAATVRQSSVLWLTVLLAIYVPAFPNVVGTIALANAFAMAFSIVPFLQARMLLVPSILGAAFAGSLYMLVMPHLHGFAALGAMIFAATFAIAYLFDQPQAAAARAMGLCMLVIVIGAENEQTYHFLYFANWFIAAIFFVLALLIGWRFPISFRPEDRFVAMLRRFFRSAGFLLSTRAADAGRQSSLPTAWRRAFHLHEVTVLPGRLQAWAGTLPPSALGNATPDQVQSLLNSLQLVGERLRELPADGPEPAFGAATDALRADTGEWRAVARGVIGRLTADPRGVDPAALRSSLVAAARRLETRLEGLLDAIEEQEGPSARECESMYRMLDAYRGLSDGLLGLTERISPIDWDRLREARF